MNISSYSNSLESSIQRWNAKQSAKQQQEEDWEIYSKMTWDAYVDKRKYREAKKASRAVQKVTNRGTREAGLNMDI